MTETSLSGHQAVLAWQSAFLKDLSLEDADERLAAIDPSHSFIVQAPAGSGKTSLLTQRFLALLALAEVPEEIVAVTFTQKAAAEMRERILEALQLADQPCPERTDIHRYNTWHLAKAVQVQDQKQQWGLLQNPQRLRVRTLDSLNAYLVQQMPLLSRLGSQATLTDAPLPFYEAAAAQALQSPLAQDAIASLFELVNGHFKRAQSLLVSMLQTRDQWMPLFAGMQSDELSKAEFDESLSVLVSDLFVQGLVRLTPVMPHIESALNCLRSVSEFTRPEWKPLLTWNFEGLIQLKNPPGLVDFENWRLLQQAMVTKSGSFKKRLTKNDGFPVTTSEEKVVKGRMAECLDALRAEDETGEWVQAMIAMAELPLPHYSEDQWRQVVHLMALLNLAAAHLKVVFSEHGQTDFIEVAQAASHALGTEQNPTELALRLDYQLKHLLVDEFQDTSISQYELLKKLVAGWQSGDGRTLFIVGDPMQSIYRFREAEVGNFLDAWEHGVGTVNVQPLNLTVNFRSKASVIDWVNRIFAQVLPAENQIEKGAVRYTASIAKQSADEGFVRCHWLLDASMDEEADNVLELIEHRLGDLPPEQTIGVLGRSRGHLMPIAMRLKASGIPFRAVELENLSERQEVQDALALARAMLHLGDRPAWLALLRTPVFGLTLSECYDLMGDPQTFREPVWTLLQAKLTDWPEDRQCHLKPLVKALAQGLESDGDFSFSQRVYETWLALGMAFSLPDESALENVQTFFDTLRQLESREAYLSKDRLDEAVASLFAKSGESEECGKVELMTMHKSKGLEFDTVILPGLGRRPRPNEKSLLNWLGFLHEGRERIVMAPLDQKGQETSALVGLIRSLDEEKGQYELGRLLYVAATRAKTQLHLFGSVDTKPSDGDACSTDRILGSPAKGSLLHNLWSTQKEVFQSELKNRPQAPLVDAVEDGILPYVARLPSQRPRLSDATDDKPLGWREDRVDRVDRVEQASLPLEENEQADSANGWVNNRYEIAPEKYTLLVKSVGNLVHAVLEQCVSIEEELGLDWIEQRKPVFRHWLKNTGLDDALLSLAEERVVDSLKQTFSHDQARWSLLPSHTESSVELALTSFGLSFENEEDYLPEVATLQGDGIQPVKHAMAHHIVDRTFVAEGYRWIIDYKTGFWDKKAGRSEEERQAFIAQQVAAYRPQLARYGRLFSHLERRPQKHVLFFTALGEWVEWEH